MFIAIVPAYNEEKTIGSVVQSLFPYVDKVVVVDDCSTDATAKFAQVAGAVVLQHKINRGQGAALETGHEYARLSDADYVLHFDADNQFEVNDVKPAFDFLTKQAADILFGSRFLDGRTKIPWFKKCFLFPLARLFNKSWGVHLSDIHNGFRILNKQALQTIKITQDRMAHATEIPVQAKKLNLKIVEFPVKVVYHEYGQNLNGGLKVIKDLIMGKFIK
jgi:glycosyltransferase involved in cell wall biosynthesis